MAPSRPVPTSGWATFGTRGGRRTRGCRILVKVLDQSLPQLSHFDRTWANFELDCDGQIRVLQHIDKQHTVAWSKFFQKGFLGHSPAGAGSGNGKSAIFADDLQWSEVAHLAALIFLPTQISPNTFTP